MLSNSYGYACKNIQLAFPERFNNNSIPRIICNRGMIKKTFIEKGISYAADLAIQNCKDLYKILKWNCENKIKFFRIDPDLFPWSSEYDIKDLKNYTEICFLLNEIGRYVTENNMRITCHPGPFNVLTSTNENVVRKCIKDLAKHGEVFDMMNFSKTTFNKINIHIGGVYGNKKSAMKRFCRNFKKLPSNVKSRLTVENDDKPSMYNVKDLYNGVFRVIGIPIVFDYHHHKFNNGNLTEKEALELSISTWGNIKPVIHYSESRRNEMNDNTIKENAHSDYIRSYINTYGHNVDIMIEAKQKELAVIKYLSSNKNIAV
tara:strand:+ start:8143 stop:9093 length:951 start_codon:yes stop_codon:yes gene_type:complete